MYQSHSRWDSSRLAEFPPSTLCASGKFFVPYCCACTHGFVLHALPFISHVLSSLIPVGFSLKEVSLYIFSYSFVFFRRKPMISSQKLLKEFLFLLFVLIISFEPVPPLLLIEFSS